MRDERYFNFPIQLLSGYLGKPKDTLDNIIDYAIYKHTLEFEYDNGIESMTKSAAKFFGLSVPDKQWVYEKGKELYRKFPVDGPKVGLSKSILWDYYKNDKTEFQHLCLLGFLGIKSILQNKAYCKMNNKFWLSRMDGKAKSVNDISELSPVIRSYANEYQTRKIKTELRDNWNLVTYSRYTRGFYVSFKMELEELIYEAEKRRKSTREKQSKFEEKIALERVLKRLYG